MKWLLVALMVPAYLCCHLPVVKAGGCYRPFIRNTGYNQAYYYPTYYYKPYVLEVQVVRDRYYSLSDLYRDRLYLEAFDLMKEMRQRLNQPQANAEVQPKAGLPVAPQSPPNLQVQPKSTLGKTSDKAKLVLAQNCQSCHSNGKPKAKLDLTDIDAVPIAQRWSSFGIAAAGDMPPVPEKEQKDGAEAVRKWKQGHALKEEDMAALYEGWVLVGSVTKANKE